LIDQEEYNDLNIEAVIINKSILQKLLKGKVHSDTKRVRFPLCKQRRICKS